MSVLTAAAIPPTRAPEIAGADHLRALLAQRLAREHLAGSTLLALGRPLAEVGGSYALHALDALGRRVLSAALCAAGPAISHQLPVAPSALEATLASLPDQVWDGLLALDLLGHVPHWSGALAGLHRLLREGGRVVLDLAALEHAEAAQGAPSPSHLGPAPGGEVLLRVTDVIQTAVGLGLQPVVVRPYAAFTGGAETHPAVRSRTVERLHWWPRLLSWVPQDGSLTALALLMDDAVVGRLGPAAAGRCLLVLERRCCTDAGAAAALAQPLGLPKGGVGQTVAAALAAHLLAGPRELKYFVELRNALGVLMPGLNLAPLLTEAAHARVAEADHRVALDTLCMAMIRGWRHLPEPRALMTFNGLSLGDVHDYHMIQMLLIFGFKAFPEVHL